MINYLSVSVRIPGCYWNGLIAYELFNIWKVTIRRTTGSQQLTRARKGYGDIPTVQTFLWGPSSGDTNAPKDIPCDPCTILMPTVLPLIKRRIITWQTSTVREMWASYPFHQFASKIQSDYFRTSKSMSLTGISLFVYWILSYK